MKNADKRDLGEAYVVRALQREQVMAQSELARKCGLSASGVSRIIDRLAAKGLILRTGRSIPAGEKLPGRPTELLKLNAAARHVLVVYVSLRQIQYLRLNLDWSMTLLEIRKKPRAMPLTDLMEEICTSLLRLTEQEAVSAPGMLCGYAVLMSGFTNGQSGHIFDSSTVAVPGDGFNLLAALTERLKYPVSLDSEGNAALLGEIAAGVVGDRQSNVVYVYYDEDGTVISFYFNGRIYRGAGSAAAGQIGCYAFEEIEPGHCRESHAYWLPPVSLNREEIAALAAAGLPDNLVKFGEIIKYQDQLSGSAAAVLCSRLERLGRGLCNVINLLNPDRLVLGGSLAELTDKYFAEVAVSFARAQLHPGRPVPVLERGRLPLLEAVTIGGGEHHLLFDLELKKEVAI